MESLKKLRILSSFSQIPNLSVTAELNDSEMKELLYTASVLSLSDVETDKINCLEICMRLAELSGKHPSIDQGVAIILSRLGNFPAIDLIAKKNKLERAIDGSFFSEEYMGNRFLNSVQLSKDDNYLSLTDFQLDIFKSIGEKKSISVSGPTSAGKSFGLLLSVTNYVKAADKAIIVIIVPTRALIRQVSRDLIDFFKKNKIEDVDVVSIPKIAEEDKDKKIVFVLTQERAQSLVYDNLSFACDLLLVDEATEIGNADRGILLINVISEILARNEDCPIIFSSALCENPEYLLNLFPERSSGKPINTQIPSVSQNLFLVEKVRGKTKKMTVSIVHGDQKTLAAEIDLNSMFRNSKMITYSAYNLTATEDSSIVYSNGAAEAEKFCRFLSELETNLSESEEIKEVIDFLKLHIHPGYSLIHFLKKGIGFHYRTMPDLVKESVEELFKNKKIRFLCATSTLLQGVNLPTKNIFLLKPRSGPGTPLNDHNFWNLVGRAGRLSKEFQGNIWCVAPDEWENEEPYKTSRLSKIKNAFSSTLEDGASQYQLKFLLENSELPADTSEAVEQAANKIISDFYLERRSLHSSQFNETASVSNFLNEIDSLRDDVSANIYLSKDIIKKNSTISVWRLQALYERFKTEQDVKSLIPIHPFEENAKGNLLKIYSLLNDTVFPQVGNSYIYCCGLSRSWMAGISLGQLIKQKITKKIEEAELDTEIEGFGPNLSEDEVSDTIRELVKEIDNIIRFQYVKFVKAYIDVLEQFLKDTNNRALIEEIQHINTFLELGACDGVTLSLMSVGLTRTTSLLITKSKVLPNTVTPFDVLPHLSKVNWNNVSIPGLCKREILGLIKR